MIYQDDYDYEYFHTDGLPDDDNGSLDSKRNSDACEEKSKSAEYEAYYE